jgi:hypothetical protein
MFQNREPLNREPETPFILTVAAGACKSMFFLIGKAPMVDPERDCDIIEQRNTKTGITDERYCGHNF